MNNLINIEEYKNKPHVRHSIIQKESDNPSMGKILVSSNDIRFLEKELDSLKTKHPDTSFLLV